MLQWLNRCEGYVEGHLLQKFEICGSALLISIGWLVFLELDVPRLHMPCVACGRLQIFAGVLRALH
jgi:hypothetical protein